MSGARDQAAFRIFDEAIDLPETNRGEFLRQRCGDDAALRTLVEQMLRQDSAIDGRTDLLPGSGAELIATELFTGGQNGLPEKIGQYRPIREIGRGGMGVVYEAEQEEPRRRVALKVIRDMLVSSEARRRFRREAQLLGQLQHPGIAHVYDAGTARTGYAELPYIAMELIDGRSIGKHAEARGLSTRQRLELVARVCDAVHHAHVKGVIHRDLKPANILVVDHEASIAIRREKRDRFENVGQPKILDFGVARITDSDRQAQTLYTEAGQVVGTLSYMSPEQLTGRSGDVDARSDIYSLGAILFELLAGRLPHDVRDRSLLEAARIIRDDDPSQLASINTSFRGDIETIVAKALAKEPDRRYQAAAEMAADIRRFLGDEPILARPAGTLYQVAKFARRNRALVGGLAATFVSLLGGLVVVSVLLAKVSSERNNATIAQRRAARIAKFQGEMLRNVDMGVVGAGVLDDIQRQLGSSGVSAEFAAGVSKSLNGRDLSRAAIDSAIIVPAVARLDSGYIDDPLVEAELRISIGEVQGGQSMFDRQLVQLERACTLLNDSLGPDAQETLMAELLKSLCLHRIFRYEEARALLESVLERAKKSMNSADPFLHEVRLAFADALIALKQLDKATAILRVEQERLKAERGANIRAVRLRLAAIDLQTGAYEQAARVYGEEAEQERTRAGGRDTPLYLNLLQNAVGAIRLSGDDDKAEPLLWHLVEGWRVVGGEDHEATIVNRTELGIFLMQHGRLDEALPELRLAYESAVRSMEPGRPHRVAATLELGKCLLSQGLTEECERITSEFIAARNKAGLPHDDDAGRAIGELHARCGK